MTLKRIYLLLLSLCCCALIGAADNGAQEKVTREHILKAKVIHSITRFVSWPELSEQSPFTICILGNRPTLESALELFFQRKPVFKDVATEIKSTTLDKTEACNMVFLADANDNKVNKALKQLAGKPVLICSDKPGLAEKGVHVNLYVESNKVRFEVNFDTAKTTGLNLSSQLLTYARIVKTRPSYE